MKRIVLVLMSLFVLIMVTGCLSTTKRPDIIDTNQTEAAEYMGIELTPISKQRNNAINGTQYIDKDTYRLRIDGMVERPKNLSYDQITAYTAVSKVVKLNCVEGWSFNAKWTGVPVKTLFNETGVDENATTVIFYSADGYSTSLDINYLLGNNIILAYKINDVTLPHDRGFPLQLVAEGKYGYKWAKWINHIELANTSYKGYWESKGYNNNAVLGRPPFE